MKRRTPIATALAPLLAAALLFAACDDEGGDAGVTATTDTQTSVDLDAATETTPGDAATETVAEDVATTTDPSDVVADTAAPTDTASATDAVADSVAPGDTAVADTSVEQDTTIVLPDERPPITSTHSAAIGDWTMPPGQERTRCVVKRLGNADELWISQVRTTLAPGSHHMIVYRSMETEEKAEPFDCDPFVETLQDNTFPLMITQRPSETLAFPNGVAFRFEPNQMVRIEAHYINVHPTDSLVAHGDVHFDSIAAEDVVAEANMLFYGNPDIEIPPNSEHSTPWGFIPVPDGKNVFAMTGHTHRFGTNVEIHYASGVEDTMSPELYPGDEEFRWDEAPVVTFDPALRFTDGAGVRYRCSWDNPTNQSINFGESATAEMCFLWAYYYPSDGYQICVNTGKYKALARGLGIELGDYECCPGSFICGFISDFL